LVTVGVFTLIFLLVVFLKSTKKEVILFDKIRIDNFKVSILGGPSKPKVKEPTL
jgi:hypothetical protein